MFADFLPSSIAQLRDSTCIAVAQNLKRQSIVTYIPHPEVSHYKIWKFGKIGLAIASPILPFNV
ncbi:MAG: hypothetical protein LDL41_15870 [Coleofasciculus sp. S288]|nr:hypothetical protein [Coleofasciculus sp. S288]